MRYTKLAAVIILVALAVVLASACGGGGASSTAASPTPKSFRASATDVNKPRPVVLSVDASTVGLLEDYYAILDITVTNEGADGMVLVVANLTQGGETAKKDMPLYLENSAIQMVKLVFPLEWKGGDWTPSVQAEVP